VGLSSSRLLYLACTIVLALIAFFPASPAGRWLDLCLAPTRVLGELASPVGWLSRSGVRAAEKELQVAVESEHAESRKLAEDERFFALPDEESLIQGRRFVHAQVVQRFRDAPDRVECALEEQVAAQLVPGLPVVLSNSYVGRVHSIDAAASRITVHLVTDKEFRIGARARREASADPEGTGAALVVGGLASTQDPGTPLAVHNPDRLSDLSGTVRVDERLNPRAPFRELCQDFRLGELAGAKLGRPEVRPEIDFAEGLFRVVVVLPPDALPPVASVDFDVFDAGNWREVRVFGAAEPAPWREGLKIDYPRSAGACEDFAVVAGARLVGFVARAGALHSDVALLGDCGVSVPAQARVEGAVEPLVLGRLISLGRTAPGAPARLLWMPAQPLAAGPDGASTRKARLFTGAGELGVPRGLVIGEALLPCGPGPHVVEVDEGVDARLLRRLWVWRESESGRIGSPRAP
jgi:hypothetical protein